MTRQPLDEGGWFDTDRAEKFEEDTRWNGSNHISKATGSTWEHQILYRTHSKRWVLHSWSQWRGSTPSWIEISDAEAAQWLVRNGHEHPDVVDEIAALEI